MHHIIGIMAMIFGFIGLIRGNNEAASICFGYALILWYLVALCEYAKYKKKNKR